MNKKSLYIALIMLLIAFSFSAGYFLKPATKTTIPTAQIKTIKEITFTTEQLEQYYATYQDPYVIALRTALNGYLDGTNNGIENPQIVIESSRRDGYIDGLSSFSNDYYKSKFIVYAIGNSVVGGKQIAIIFQDKPDKLFNALVYKLADGVYDLRGFSQNLSYTPEKMKNIGIQYKVKLTDTKHAL